MTTVQQPQLNRVTGQGREWRLFPLLLLFGTIFEFFYLLLVALSPFPGLHLANTPLPEVWQWTLLPSQTLISLLHPLIGNLSHYEWYSSLLLGITLTILTGTYAGTILSSMSYTKSERTSKNWLFFFLVTALIFGITLMVQPLLFSDDIFTYIFSGRITAIYGLDPLNTIPNQFPRDPFLQWVVSGHDTPNIYGPLWLFFCSLLVRITAEPVTTLLIFKGVILLSHLLNILLVWAILGKISPSRQLAGTLLYAWNPLALIELAGSGHSEGILLLLLLLATWCYVQARQPVSTVCSLFTFGIAISSNLIALLLAPLFIWFDLRTIRGLPSLLWGICWRVLILLCPTMIIALPFWRSPYTFFAITSAVDMEHFVHAPVSTLATPVRHLFQFIAQVGHFPAYLQPITAADVTVRASVTFIFLLIYLDLFGKVRAAPATINSMRYSPSADPQIHLPGFDILLDSWSTAIFWYLILVSGWFWPWYILWMLWIVVLRRFDAFSSTILVLASTALFIYPFVGFTRAPISTYQSALIFGIPLVYLITVILLQRFAERTSIPHD